MSNQKGGGPAFPVVRMPVDPDTVMNHPGMELRDWFAGQALVGLLSAYGHKAKLDSYGAVMIHTSLFQCAWDVADQMLKAREAT